MKKIILTILLLISTSTGYAETWHTCAQDDYFTFKVDTDSITIKEQLIGVNVFCIEKDENRPNKIKYSRANFFVNTYNHQYKIGTEFHFDVNGNKLESAPPTENWATAQNPTGKELIKCIINLFKMQKDTV